MTATLAVFAFCLVATAFHFVSLALAARRLRATRKPLAFAAAAPGVSIVRPLCGIEPFSAETLGSTFALDYPTYEIVFCVARAADPIVPLVRGLMAAHPDVPARLLVGDDRLSLNPKLNNVVKGWDAARQDWVIMADSNVLMPRDYVQRLLARWRRDSGVVCSVPIGSRPENFWAVLECAFLNGYEARFEYAADTLGIGYAQGKSMLLRRSILDPRGGIRALATEIAEDAALTKLLHRAGRKVHLVDDAFEQPLGRRRFAEVWCRQRRWARLRRMTFPLVFLPELIAGSFFPILSVLALAPSAGLARAVSAFVLLGSWLAAEAALARRAGWHWSWSLLPAMLLRDLLLPALWIDAWLGSSFTWRGTEMRPRTIRKTPESTAA